MAIFRAVAVGGTFDPIHKGHKALFSKAFEVGSKVVIGITTDSFANRLGKEVNSSFSMRLAAVEEYLRNKFPERNYVIKSLNDFFGAEAYTKEIEALVATPETALRVDVANKVREKQGIDHLRTIIIEIAYADDGRPISSTRIRSGEIDEEGHILSRDS